MNLNLYVILIFSGEGECIGRNGDEFRGWMVY